jgi:thiol peroxidase
MKERTGFFTFKGAPLTLLGNDVKVGDRAPDFQVLDNDMKPVTLADFKGKVLILSAVTSLDTATCDTETRRFNAEATKLGDDVVIVTVSMDLPFAQKRWCGAAGIDRVQTVSDYKDASFGEAYGVLIKELRLLARTVFIVNREGVVQYVQRVKEGSGEPDYDAVMGAVGALV